MSNKFCGGNSTKLISVKSRFLSCSQIHVTTSKILPNFTTQVDVLAELNDKTQVVIEIQVAYQIDFIKRLWIYISANKSQEI